jgi:hypothetical protein
MKPITPPAVRHLRHVTAELKRLQCAHREMIAADKRPEYDAKVQRYWDLERERLMIVFGQPSIPDGDEEAAAIAEDLRAGMSDIEERRRVKLGEEQRRLFGLIFGTEPSIA